MTYLSRDEILSVDDLRTEDVKVPEWGGVVRVRELTGTELDSYQASMMSLRDGETVPEMANMRAKLVTRSIIGDDGEPLFTELDIGRLGQKSGVALQRVYDVASRLSGISAASEDEATASLKDQSDDSSSGSPES
jgi:hypothetical protein